MNIDPTTTECTIEFTVSPAWFQTIRRLIFASSLHCGFGDRDAGQIAMAVDEALANIHKHGYQSAGTGKAVLSITTFVHPMTKIDIQIDDQTAEIDLASIQSRDLNDIRPGGLGVHLIQTIMDDSNWSKLESGGIRLSLSKTQDNDFSCEKTNG